jgi:hypothetical protein
MSQLLTSVSYDGSAHPLPGHPLLFFEAILKPQLFDEGNLGSGDELMFCMSRCAARSQASQQPSAEFPWRNRGHSSDVGIRAFRRSPTFQRHAVLFLILYANSKPIALLCCRCTPTADSV